MKQTCYPCGSYAFVRVYRGFYVRTDRCVAEVPGACGAGVGELCVGREGEPSSGTHFPRRDAWQEKKRCSK